MIFTAFSPEISAFPGTLRCDDDAHRPSLLVRPRDRGACIDDELAAEIDEFVLSGTAAAVRTLFLIAFASTCALAASTDC